MEQYLSEERRYDTELSFIKEIAYLSEGCIQEVEIPLLDDSHLEDKVNSEKTE